MKEYFFARKN